MSRARTTYSCSSCGAELGKWYGRCPRCQEFSTVAEIVQAKETGLKASSQGSAPRRPARRVTEIHDDEVGTRLGTGIAELDRVLGGGLVAGQVLLLSGEPGARNQKRAFPF